MADQFLSSLQNFKQTFSLSDIDPNMDFQNHFSGLIPSHHHHHHQDNPGLNLMGFSNDNLFPQLPEFPGNLENFPGLFFQEDNKPFVPSLAQNNVVSSTPNDHKEKKRKAMEINTPESSSANSSPQGSDNGIRKKNSLDRGKRVKGNGKEEENQREVVHVRAKRGQATDSHSLAERVRRGKINERLRCLQDIVPGCYKTMGMAVMLDEIINYVQSLQNQVEFLSMKLTAASTFHDFNSDGDVIDTMQRAKTIEALKTQSAAIQGLTSAHFAPLDLNFGYFPQLPHNS